MSIHATFLFPKQDFSLVFMNTIGYISDNLFYRLNFETSQTEIELNPRGRSYQAFTSNHKKGVIVLADYGRNPCLYFHLQHVTEGSFEMSDFCQLEIRAIVLSLDCKYLLVCCGLPENEILIIDVESRRVLKGEKSRVGIDDRKVLKMEFNPSNNKIFAVMYEREICIYQIMQKFGNSHNNELQEYIEIVLKSVISSESLLQTFAWDEINNIYVSNGKHVFVYSTDIEKEVISYDLEGDFDGRVIANFIQTQKHLILVYCNGRIEWINKFYPDLLDEEELSRKPFYLDKFYEFSTPINHAIYDHLFTKIFVSHKNGYFSLINKGGETRENEEDDEDNKGVNRSKEEKSKKVDLEIIRVGPYHANHIVFCRQIKGKSVLMTISRAGRVILWSVLQKKPIASAEIESEIVSADVNQNFTTLCTSNGSGDIHFYSISDYQNIFLFKQFKLVEKGFVNEVKFSSNSKEVACLSSQNKKIFYILTEETQDIEMLGYVNLQYSPLSICWNRTTKTLIKPKFQHLLCCVGFGILMINGPQAVSTKFRGKQLQLSCDIYALRTDLDQKLIEVLPNGEILTTGADKLLKKYKQPEEPISKFNPEIKIQIPAPMDELETHDLETTFMKVSDKYFISGGADGSVQIRSLDNFNNSNGIQVSGWRNGNLFTGGISQIQGLYYSCGKDGCLSMWKTNDLNITLPDTLKKDKSTRVMIQSQRENLKVFEIAIQNEYLEKMNAEISRKKKDQLDKVLKIKTDLKRLLAENEENDQLERLSRDQFVIDIDLRDRVTKIGLENRERIKKESNRNVLLNEVYRNKLKQITWDQMQEYLRAINGLKNNYLVYNYQIRKISNEEKRKLKLILDLRKLQIKESKKRPREIIDTQLTKNKNVINGGVLQPLILTILEKKDEKKDDKIKKKKQDEAAEKQQEEVEEIPKDEVWQLLYTSFELFSDNSKRNQIVMMENVIIKIKETFNKEFNKLLKYRQSQNESINDKNKRIIEICQQLKRPSEVLITNKNILQNPEAILQVSPKDIPFARYLSRQQRQKIEKEKLKEQERLRALAEDDSSQRALQKMMGGTLQEKKVSVLEVNVERQKWMDKSIEEMNEEEKAKYKQYEQKKIKAEEEKQRIVKKLQAELRKLKLEIDEIMEKYDEKLFNLLRRRIQYDLRIQEQQLYCIKLSLSMQNVKDQAARETELKNQQAVYQKRIQQLESIHDDLSTQEEQLQKAKQAKKGSLDMKRLGDLETKVKTIEKSVFEQYQSNIKKRREFQQKIIQNDVVAQYQIITLDPMKELELKALSNQKSQEFKLFLPEIKSLQQTYDFPDTLYNILENRFNIRKQQAEFDRKLKGVKQTLKKLQFQTNQLRSKQSQEQKQLSNIHQYLQKSNSDLQIQIRIKKGLVQIDSETPVPKLEDALLIGKGQIDDKNRNIVEKAELKIGVMKEIKACKISVTEETLELKRKQSLIDESSIMIKEVQMLKVKKEMQTALAKKDTKINENQLKSLKEQIEKVRKEGEKRISLFEKKIEKVNQEIETIRKQNKQLEVQKWNLQNTVKQRQKIKDMMVGQNGEGNQEAAEKFDQISINRKLFDKAKQQTDQIELLREELSKLKAKTFANFSSVQR